MHDWTSCFFFSPLCHKKKLNSRALEFTKKSFAATVAQLAADTADPKSTDSMKMQVSSQGVQQDCQSKQGVVVFLSFFRLQKCASVHCRLTV